MKIEELITKADKMQEQILEGVESYYKLITPKHLFIALLGLHLFSTSGSVYNAINSAPPYGDTANGIEIIA